ncbi:MAG: helix-turn-helix transcriptional regulator [Mogibacterium sp.]|nr:helix-turn-helix transcriptional regulator [Mogibacterium sp.]
MELGKRILGIRKENDLTQDELAEICSVTRQTISNWENGKSYPDLDTLVVLSDSFGVSLDALLKGDREMVSEITKEQKQGRYHRIKMVIAVIIVATVFLASILILQNTFTTLKPSDYQITVREITLEDVTVDKDKEIATYIDPDGPDYIIKDNGEKVSISSERHVINDTDYFRLLTTGHLYEVILTTDKYYDTYVLGSEDEPNTLEITVERSNINFNAENVSKRVSMICSEDFDKIIDSKSKSIVWQAND